MKLPREIDELMWDVAERDDSDTLDQFVERYPEFRSELAKRLQMVRGLRGSRPVKSMPAFEPKQTVRNFGPSRLTVTAVVGFVMVSVVFATFATMQYLDTKSPPPVIEPTPEAPIVTNPPVTASDGGGLEARPFPKFDTSQEFATQYISAGGTVYDSLVTIESEDIGLEAAIREIVEKAGLDVTIGPGLAEKRIRLKYVEQPAISILHDLGRAFGFTPFRQGDAEVLVVPARDKALQPDLAIPILPNSAVTEDLPDDTAKDEDGTEEAAGGQDSTIQ